MWIIIFIIVIIIILLKPATDLKSQLQAAANLLGCSGVTKSGTSAFSLRSVAWAGAAEPKKEHLYNYIIIRRSNRGVVLTIFWWDSHVAGWEVAGVCRLVLARQDYGRAEHIPPISANMQCHGWTQHGECPFVPTSICDSGSSLETLRMQENHQSELCSLHYQLYDAPADFSPFFSLQHILNAHIIKVEYLGLDWLRNSPLMAMAFISSM